MAGLCVDRRTMLRSSMDRLDWLGRRVGGALIDSYRRVGFYNRRRSACPTPAAAPPLIEKRRLNFSSARERDFFRDFFFFPFNVGKKNRKFRARARVHGASIAAAGRKLTPSFFARRLRTRSIVIIATTFFLYKKKN